MKSFVEIMAPAGSWESLHAAINAGANSIYLGLEALNMRSHSAHNFSAEDLYKIVAYCKEKNIKTYVTLNSIIYDEDLTLMKNLCHTIKDSGADAAICCDIAVLEYAKSIQLNTHISTQANVCNTPAVRFFSQYSDVIVLARELSLSQIKEIYDNIHKEQIKGPNGQLVKIELFVHGAFCISVSGKCHMSLLTTNQSANRGMCVQNCRRKYKVTDEQTGDELVLDNHYVMSPKDLCTIEFIDQILDAGVSVLKIEGRGRAPEYVATVIKTYKEAVDAYLEGSYTPEKTMQWKERLQTVYNRGFWDGYYLGSKIATWSGSPGSQATVSKIHVGKVTNYFPKINVAEMMIESHRLKVGDKILVIGDTTGVVEGMIESIHTDKPVNEALKGVLASFPISLKVRKNDKVYVLEEKNSQKLKVLS